MIYDEIIDKLTGIIVSSGLFNENEILIQNQIPDANLSLFCRLVWSIGQTNGYTNNNYIENSILTIEVFQQKYQSTDSIFDIVYQLRKHIKQNFYLIKGTDYTANLQSINLIKNNNQSDWNGYNISISFQLLD